MPHNAAMKREDGPALHLVAPSPNRQRLAEIIEARRELEARISQADTQLQQLDTAVHAEVEARQAIDALAQTEREAMLAWATGNPADPMPTPDVARHRELGEALASATATATAAKAARGDLGDQKANLEARLGAEWREVPSLITAILVEEVEPLIPELSEIEARRYRVLAQVLALTELLKEQSFSKVDREEATALATLADDIIGRVRPFTEPSRRLSAVFDVEREKWSRLSQQLSSDAAAAFPIEPGVSK